MLLAERKKQQNISQYIIYMYQTELLIRNFEFDLSQIQNEIVNKIPAETLDEKGKLAEIDWYRGLIKSMKEEGLEKTGHLRAVQELVKELSDLSLNLLTEDPDYQVIFNAARPAIRENIIASDGNISDPIQACLNGVFGLLIARMKDEQVSEEEMAKIEHFGNVLSYLSHKRKVSN
ncbi:DUF4924 family protein [Roseivirga misakiensis]|uniref:DUF4924 domain-containing protein n=1 Tax=Roseivirga misakiensis TaxID=1563681 RepID=A0A1E5T2T9_9BACT|nr:DUF4924 family protein [Roseivirga misakiensis]OEK05689.1 hypothetical protein BFP71_06080 [Roseivirga misakiensis]